MSRSRALALGLDFGTESVRALLVSLTGQEAASAVSRFTAGQITQRLPSTGETLPPNWALQDPRDWLRSAAAATKRALRDAAADPQNIIGIGVDFTSCTVLPCAASGEPLCQRPRFAGRPHAWPKLWKHHGAAAQTDRINELARRSRQPWLARYGGAVGLEWLLPKALEVAEQDPEVWAATDLWIEGGDWLVWMLTGGDEPVRSTCQAGYKACWSADKADTKSRGYPPDSFLSNLHTDFAGLAPGRLRGALLPPGTRAGELSTRMARRLGLREGTPVSAAVIDAHAGVPGAGVAAPDTMVCVMGTSSCHMLMSREDRKVRGIAGIVRDGILPGFVGYETGQAAVGDAFAWLARLTGRSLDALTSDAADLPPGADGLRALDWMHGCRTPLMDGALRGAFTGLTLHTDPPRLHRALMEATGCGLRWIVETLRDGGVPVERFVATGGLPHHNPLLVQIYADILDAPITIHPSRQGPALGAAILGALAAGRQATGFASASAAVRAMASPGESARTLRPRKQSARAYDKIYSDYRRLADFAAAPHH